MRAKGFKDSWNVIVIYDSSVLILVEYISELYISYNILSI